MTTTARPDKNAVFLATRKVVSAILEVPEEEISLESKFIEDLSADSIKSSQIIFSLEEEFGIDIDEGEIANFRSIRDTVEYLSDRLLND